MRIPWHTVSRKYHGNFVEFSWNHIKVSQTFHGIRVPWNLHGDLMRVSREFYGLGRQNQTRTRTPTQPRIPMEVPRKFSPTSPTVRDSTYKNLSGLVFFRPNAWHVYGGPVHWHAYDVFLVYFLAVVVFVRNVGLSPSYYYRLLPCCMLDVCERAVLAQQQRKVPKSSCACTSKYVPIDRAVATWVCKTLNRETKSCRELRGNYAEQLSGNCSCRTSQQARARHSE